MEREGSKKIHTPSNILEGNGVVFKNFTINNLQLLVYFLFIEFLFQFFFRMMMSC